MPVTILPAIDLMDGRAVRLRQGRKNERTEYFADPTVPACRFTEAGARFIHVVDLDGAFEGVSKNLDSVARIVEAVEGRAAVELGGGIRSLERAERILDLGVSRVILGTAVLTDPGLPAEAVRRFGPERIVVGLDARDGRVAVRGWEELSGALALDVARGLSGSGVERIIYTDIATDGMLSGPNLPALESMARVSGLKVIASGGISSLEHVRAVAALEKSGVEGMIIGKAIYDGALSLEEALAEAG